MKELKVVQGTASFDVKPVLTDAKVNDSIVLYFSINTDEEPMVPRVVLEKKGQEADAFNVNFSEPLSPTIIPSDAGISLQEFLGAPDRGVYLDSVVSEFLGQYAIVKVIYRDDYEEYQFRLTIKDDKLNGWYEDEVSVGAEEVAEFVSPVTPDYETMGDDNFFDLYLEKGGNYDGDYQGGVH